MSTNQPVVDLDINELVALLLTKGEEGANAAESILDESLGSMGPLANLLVHNALNDEDRTEEYKLPRNYTGSIVHNKLIASKVMNFGLKIMAERGLVNEEGFTNELLAPIAQVLSNPQRAINNLILLAEFDRDTFIQRITPLGANIEEVAKTIPIEPPNGRSFPVTAYSATIISTEHGGVVIAPNDFNSMLFDLQLIPPMPVGSFIKDLVNVADGIDLGSKERTLVYEVKIPGNNGISSVVFSDAEGNWSAPFITPEEDIDYVTLVDTDGVPLDGILVAANKTDLLDANKLRGEHSISNLDEVGNYLARLSTVPLARSI